MKRTYKTKGQSTLEYAVVTAVVISALLVMGWKYFKGAYQGKLREAGDQIGQQFDTEKTAGKLTQKRASNTTETYVAQGSAVTFGTTGNEDIDSEETWNTAALEER